MTPNATDSLRTQVRHAIETAWRKAEVSGALPALPGDIEIPVDVERPADAARGDFASPVALKLAKPLRRAPLQIAQAIATSIATIATDPASVISAGEVVPPGFLNLRLSDAAL